MKFKPVVSNRVKPEKIGIEIKNEEYEKIQNATDEDGVTNLAEVYNVPVPSKEDNVQKTVVKLLEHEGIEYSEKEYQKEYQLRAAHQIMINGGSTAQIAQHLNISLNAAKNLKRELAARQLNEIKNFDAQQEIAKAYMFYDHVAAKALQFANKAGDKQLRSAIEGLKVALQAQSDKQKFLALAGAYETGLRSGTGDNKHTNDANDVRDMLTAVMSGNGTYEVVEEEDELKDGIEVLS